MNFISCTPGPLISLSLSYLPFALVTPPPNKQANKQQSIENISWKVYCTAQSRFWACSPKCCTLLPSHPQGWLTLTFCDQGQPHRVGQTRCKSAAAGKGQGQFARFHEPRASFPKS